MTYLPAILSLSKGGPLVFVEPDRSDLVHLLLHGDLKELWIFLKVRKSCISVSLIHLIYVLVIKKPAKQFARQNQFTDFYMLSVFNAVVLPTVTGFIPSSPAPINEHLECLNPFHATDLSIPPESIRKPLVFCFQWVDIKTSRNFWGYAHRLEVKLDLTFILVEIRHLSMRTNRLTVTYLTLATCHRQDQ